MYPVTRSLKTARVFTFVSSSHLNVFVSFLSHRPKHTLFLRMTGTFPPTFRPQRRTELSIRYDHERNECISVDLEDTMTYQSSSLDLTQRLERKLAKYNASKNVFTRWLLELLS
ncbi:uncharacterized protein EKO05_0005940 [Ascochyta rabiei]|uniref:uncharacterized protein n=1 Tax=Didymella rabiei TaxID=5454 RepID=UPI0021FC7D85|nr:uncharacterized protein EKO05_0005940 [Ascochyta rabiei]UPX15494.1 hypothetical protein EKO05_0005940 [Ascochyta rabiei]